MTSARIQLSLVIPAFEEARRLPATLAALRALRAEHADTEIIFVVEPSRDATATLLHQAALLIPDLHVIENAVHRGKGYAVRTGMLAARGEWIFFMDTDLSVPLTTVHECIEKFRADPTLDVIIGDRRHDASRILVHQNFFRQSLGRIFNRLIRAGALRKFPDTQCGFKGFRRAHVSELFSELRTDGFAFDVEVLLRAVNGGLRVESHPVRWTNSPDSKVRILRDSLRMLAEVLRIRWHFFRAPPRKIARDPIRTAERKNAA